MGHPRKAVMVRLPRGEMEERFAELCRRFRGLPPSAVMRMLVADLLRRPIEEQVEVVDRQIRGGDEGGEQASVRLDPARNTNRLRHGTK